MEFDLALISVTYRTMLVNSMTYGDSPLRGRPLAIGLVTAVVAVLSFACGGPSAAESVPSPPATPTSDAGTAQPDETAAASAGPSATQPPGRREEYDSNTNMLRLFARVNHPLDVTSRALKSARENGDASQVPVIIELLQFLEEPEFREEAAETLGALTGQEIGASIDEGKDWLEWLGRHSTEYPPPSGYPRWKTNLFSLIDRRYVEFLESADETSRIYLPLLRWAGELLGAIQDLQDPPTIPAAQADYLAAEDRVFGVSINGEHRAYPLRIMNPHEMANDVLGGEPIVLAY